MVIHVLQDCFATIRPFPYYPGDPDEFNLEQDLDEVMYGRPHGIYRVKLRPYTARDSTRDYEVDLVYFTAMEPLNLPSRLSNPTQSEAGFKLLYEPGPWPPLEPVLHVGYVSNILCRAPLVPCFLDGAEHPTIPHSMRTRELKTRFPLGPLRADTRPASGDGSRVYEVNMWLWKIGRAIPRRRPVRN